MRQRALIASMASALLFVVALSVGCLAGEIKSGATRQVKPNSIWFEDVAKFNKWQDLKKSGDSAAFTSYQTEALSGRDAWQFTSQLTVKILGHEPAKNQINVEMTSPGRLLGSSWFLDMEALEE